MNRSSVLIVDDNIDFAFSLGEILKDENYDVECVYSGEEAVEIIQQQDFDIVLLDMTLPRISGVEVLFQVRKIKPEIKVLMMSGHSVTDLLAQAVDGGIYRIYKQPYQLDSLLATLRGISDNGLVLVIDGGPDIAKSVKQALTGDGYSMLVTEHGPEAVERVIADGFNFLILDQQRPVIRGLEVYWELRKQGHAVPTVIVTPCPKEEQVTTEKLNQFPVCGYFIKPFNPLELLPVLSAIAEK